METESFSSLVFGALSGGAWKTITSYQRFAGWVASILVSGAIFKIKLAHVKAVFQFVHGFLGAKSVSKDNMKLFCMEFASQQSLEAAFLIELTSSVHLVTLKIAKSLVVSESVSLSAAVALRDVPLSVSAADIKTAFSVFGSVAYVMLKPAGIWLYVVVYFEKLDSAVSVLNYWSVLAKLVNFSSGCTAFEISDMISQVGGQTCFIPHSPDSGHFSLFPPPKAPKMFKPHFVGSLSYAKASASSVMSEFPSLVASTPSVTVVDPAIGSRLNSLEKQISNLAALVKFIVESVGSLVVLISRFLDDNAVKTVQLKKNLFSMKYAFNNFANFLVGVSKNIACLRFEVDFGGMDYDNIQATKSFFLSENTVEHVVTLWQMSDAKYDKSKPFFDYEATVGSVIAVMKKATKVSGSEGGFKTVVSRKKRKGGVLAESIDNSEVADKALGNHSWDSEAGDTTESESIDMKEECLNSAFAGGDPDQMLKSLHIKTKKVLGKPLGVIDYDTVDVDDDVLDGSFLLPPPLPIKLSVQVPVRKSFALDIDLVAEKLNFVRKIFSDVNGFGRASAPSKFGGIIQASFTSEKVIMAAAQLTNDYDVVVNTDLKRPINNRMNWTIVLKEIPMGTSIEAVHAAISEFGLIKSIKMQLVGLWQKAIIELKNQIQADLLAVKWSVLIGKNAVRVARADVDKQTWDTRDEFRALFYTLPMSTTTYDLWNFIGLVGGKTCVIECSSVSYVRTHCATVCFDSEGSLIQAMANTSVIKGIGLHWSCLTAALCSICRNSSYTSLTCHTAGVFSSPRSKRASLSAQNQLHLAKIYEKKSAPVSHPLAFNGKIWASMVGKPLPLALFSGSAQSGSVSYDKPLPTVSGKLEDHLKNIESSLVSLVRQIGELAKRLDSFVPAVSQPSPGWEDIVMGVGLDDVTSDKTAAVTSSTASPEVVKLKNMLESLFTLVISLSVHLDISIFTESKLKGKVCPWLANKFDGVRIFTSGLDFGSSGAETDDINFLIAKAVNESSFVVLGGDFNEDGICKSASFKKCFDLGLVNALGGSNSRGVVKTIDYMFISSSLVNTVVDCGVTGVEDFFDTDYKAVSVSFDFGNADEKRWNNFKDATLANGLMFSTLAKARKSYRFAKLLESKRAEEFHIRVAIDKRMKSFKSDKGYTIKSVLERPFHKVVLDHLVVGDKLILEPSSVKARGGWDHGRLDQEAQGGARYLRYLVLPVQAFGKEAWISMIPKLYKWKGVLMNIRPIALIETAHKILSKILLNRISLAYSTFDVLREDNFLVLKSMTTQFPIFAIGSVIEDALEKNPGAFVNDTIWVGSSQSATQHILNVASEFFNINDISINNNKTVAISINCDGMAFSLLISGSPISITKKRKSHHYLGIYLSTEGLSKPSLAKVHSDVWFFSNLVLKKAVSDKQLSYLVSAVLFSIIGYRTQFSYIPISSCRKWDTLICKGLRSKSGLPCDFSNDTIHYPFLYGLKTFEQVQVESKLALVVSFANSVRILGCLFSHWSHDLQVFCWCPLHPLQCPVCVKVNSLNNFLVGVMHIFSGCDLLLGGSLTSAFRHRSGTPMSLVLGESNYVKSVSSLQHYGIAFVDQLWNRNGTVFEWKTFKWWKRLDPYGLVPVWFELSVRFLGGVSSLPVCSMFLADCGSSDVLRSHEFGVIGASLFNSNVGHFSVYTDGSLSNLGTVDIKAGAAVFFKDIGMGLGVGVSGLMFSILMELQTITLVLECVPSSRLVDLFSDSQAALNACRLEMELVRPDFRNWCWIECCHIVNVIHHKNLKVNWCKVKGHSGVLGNEQANKLARTAALSGWHLPYSVDERYLRGGGAAISSNSRHFVWDIFWSVHRAH
ncbi:hypothetical protein G9A89_000728 [Geosiphon pyriformis]|nr:hypothetical protein G9A89_000728 [Geosiphon pyriformis]